METESAVKQVIAEFFGIPESSISNGAGLRTDYDFHRVASIKTFAERLNKTFHPGRTFKPEEVAKWELVQHVIDAVQNRLKVPA